VVKCAAWAGEKQQGKEVHTARQLRLTYLLHLVERRLVHAKLLEVILRRLDDLVDDLLVDVTLQLLSARVLLRERMAWHVLACAGRRQLTTTWFDMATSFRSVRARASYLGYGTGGAQGRAGQGRACGGWLRCAGGRR
jgi:hypothetical protein